MQTFAGLPSGTSAPNTVITEYAVSKYQLQTQLAGWLIQAPAPLTATGASGATRRMITAATAAAAGWLLAGREPTVISRQPLE